MNRFHGILTLSLALIQCLTYAGQSAGDLLPVTYSVRVLHNDLIYHYTLSFQIDEELFSSDILIDGTLHCSRFSLMISDERGSVSVEFPMSTAFPNEGYTEGGVLGVFSVSEVFDLPQRKDTFEPDGFVYSTDDITIERRIGKDVRRVVRMRGTSVSVDYIEKEFQSLFESLRSFLSSDQNEQIESFLKEHERRKLEEYEREIE